MRAAVYLEPRPRIRKCGTAVVVIASLVLLLAAAIALVQTGLKLGRTFSDPSAVDTAARIGTPPDISYPCGVEVPCFEKGRYQPIWL